MTSKIKAMFILEKPFGSKLETQNSILSSSFFLFFNIYESLLNMPKNSVESCVPENYPDYFKFLSRAVASLNSVNSTAETVSRCFTKTHFTYSRPDSKTVLLTIEAEDATSLLCTDNYLFATPDNYHFDIVEFKGCFILKFYDFLFIQKKKKRKT